MNNDSSSNPMRSVQLVTNPNNSKMPFTVCCVVGSKAEATEFEEVVAVHKFCVETGIDYTCREFDSGRYEEDATQIQKLPSFYIYDRRQVVQDTFYAETDPVRRIREEIMRVRMRNEEAGLRAATRVATRAARWSMFTSIFRRPAKIAASK
jgi:hypothetical protein